MAHMSHLILIYTVNETSQPDLHCLLIHFTFLSQSQFQQFLGFITNGLFYNIKREEYTSGT